MSNDRETYYRKAATWASDDEAVARSNLRWSRILAGGAATIAVLEAFALLLLMPLKTASVVPVLVDRQTGFVEVLNKDGRMDLRSDRALTQSLLAQYVQARESFDITNVSEAYRKVALWSSGAARADYLASMPVSNPQSPFRRYPRSTVVTTWIKSISPTGPQGALVRFETVRRDQDGRAIPPSEWAAIISYHVGDAPASFEDRLVNPLGFQVARYRKDPEVLPPPTVDGSDRSASAREVKSEAYDGVTPSGARPGVGP